MIRRRGVWLVAVLFVCLARPLSAQVLVGSCVMTSGSGSPESAVTGNVCDTYLRTDTGDLYQKTSGTGTTGWSLLPRVDAANVYTSGQQELTATFPRWIFTDSDQAADTQKWRVGSQSGQFFIQAVNDALSVTQSTVFTALRSGDVTFPTSVTAASLVATTGSLTSTMHVGGNFDVGTTKHTVNASTGLTTINGNTASLPSALAGTLLQIGHSDSASTRIEVDAFANAGQMTFRRANNTAASPSAVASGEQIARVGASGYGATGYIAGSRAAVDFVASQTWTDSVQGAYVALLTTPNGSATLTERVRIHGSGGVSIGTVSTDPGTNVLGVTADILPFNNYASSLGSFTARFLSLYAAELWVQTLVAQSTQATIGGRILVAPTNTLTAPLAAAATQIQVKYNNFANGDRVYMEANGALEWMAIASAASGSAGAYLYTVTRNLDGSGADNWVAGDAVVSTGTTGSGYLDIFSVAGVLGTGSGPTIVGNVRTGTTYNQVSPRWAIGNLRSLYGYAASDLYGAAFGDPSATNITIDATNGLRIRNGTTNKLTADTSGNLSLVGDFSMSTSGVFRAGATAFGTGTGWWMDYNSGTPRFRIGVPSSGNRLEWDGTNLVLVSANLTVNSSGVTIGGAPGGFSGSSAYNFTRPTGLGFGQSGDVFAMWFLSSSGLDDLVVQNKIVGTGTSDGIARVILKAQGWENNAGGSSTTESSIELNSGVANQQILLTAPVIDFAGSTRVSVSTALFRVTNASANLEVTNGTTTMSTQPGFFGTTSNHAWIAMTNNGTNATFCAAGGITIASPTGGCKGSGTLNATAVYDDNVLLTDWVFQLYYLGATANAQRVPATRSWPPARRLYTLSEVSTITQQEHRLPWMPRESEFETERHTGGMITRLYQGQEQQQIYIMELEARIRALEQATAAGRR